MTDVIKEGYLTKRAIRSGRSWKRRYFVATNSSLSYYKSRSDFVPGAKHVPLAAPAAARSVTAKGSL